jgi:23S rRNA (uridine2552-2'-O)-methyltransferase
VDLGAAPGGWLQVTSRLVGPKGRVIGIDLQPIDPIKEENVVLLKGDIYSEHSQRQIKKLLGSAADCVLSDLSPRLSGIRDADVSRSVALAEAALDFAHSVLKAGGSFLVKTFMGQETEDFAAKLKGHFDSLQRSRPEATRKASSEIYLIARGFKAPSQKRE